MSVSAHHVHLVEIHCAFDKVFLRVAPCRMTEGNPHRHQADTPTFSSPSTPTEKDNVGMTGLPGRFQGGSGRAGFVPGLVSCVAPSFSASPHLLGGQAQHALGFRLRQLVWEAGTSASQSRGRAQEEKCGLGYQGC